MATSANLPVLVRSVGPEPSAGYYTQWTTFIPGYPKYKNQDTGVTLALYETDGVTLKAYRAHHLYYTGQGGQIVDRTIEFNVAAIPAQGQYYDIPVSAYQEPGTGLSPDPGNSQNTGQPSGSVHDIVLTEGVALRANGNKRLTPWMTPRHIQEREVGANRWANLSGAAGGPTPASINLNPSLSTQLVIQDFGFRLPEGARVKGIEIEVARKVVGGAVENRGRWIVGDDFIDNKARVYISLGGYQYRQARVLENRSSHVVGVSAPYAVASGSRVFGQQCEIVYSANYGASWSLASHSLPVDYSVVGIAMDGSVAVATVYGYTSNYHVLRSTDYGATWSVLDTGVPMSGNHFSSQIATDGAGTFVFGTNAGTILYSTDYGATWTSVPGVLSTAGGYHAWITELVFDGTKFIASSPGGSVGTTQIANSADGITWALRYQAPAGVGHQSPMSVVNGHVALLEWDGADRQVTYSADHGDSWSRSPYPENIYDNWFYSVVYEPVRGVYLFLGAYADEWPVIAESPDFPPTEFRILADTDAEHWGEWGVARPPTLAGLVPDGYGVSYEEVRLLVGGTGEPLEPADAIYDEGRAISGGTFAYRETFLFMGSAEGDLRNTSATTFGGPDRRGSDENSSDLREDWGARVWTAAEVNAPSFGFGYQAEGSQGILQLGGVRMRIHYSADLGSESLPAKRAQGLAAVAHSPGGVKVAVGVDGKILRKPANSDTWAQVASGVASSLYGVTWAGDRFIAVGFGGVALDGGADGTTWARMDSGAVSTLWAVRGVPKTRRAIAVGADDIGFHVNRGVWS